MNYALTLRHPVPVRSGLLLTLCIAFWLAAALSFAPTLRRTAGIASHSEICKCAHCPGGAACCCRTSLACPNP